MSEMSINIEGLDELKQAMQQATTMMRKEVARAVEETTYNVHEAVVKRLQSGPASGVTYELYTPRRTHQASAPGQPPMTDTSDLVNSYQVNVTGLKGQVYSELKKSVFLEVGTSNMKKRPHLFPSLEENTPVFLRKLRSILQ